MKTVCWGRAVKNKRKFRNCKTVFSAFRKQYPDFWLSEPAMDGFYSRMSNEPEKEKMMCSIGFVF